MYSAEPIFAFHHINAYEEEGEIILDLAAYHDESIVGALYLDQLRTEAGTVPLAKLRRYRISLDGDSVSREAVADLIVELPRINYRACNMRRHRFVFGVSRTGATHGVYDSLVKTNLESGESKEWSEERCFPGEPVIVASPDAVAEDEGVVLAVVLDANQQKSFLLVLDAHSFEEVARAQVPQHIPFGFHGQFYAAVAT
jgi:carotenoid cleavage dioxygenase-like enzyme